MFYSKEELQTLPRKDLQKLCKQFAIKANKKNCELVSNLVDYFANLQHEEKEFKKNLEETKEWISEDEAEKATSSQELKDELMKEVEKRTNEKLSKIPRFCAENVIIPSLMSPATQQLKNAQKKHFKKMESIDVYLEKKKTRAAQYQKNCSNRLKEIKKQAEDNLKKMKLSHNTPKANTAVAQKKPKEGTPLINRTKTLQTSRKRPSNTSFKVDKEVTFNFVSKLKSPKVARPTLKEKNSNIVEQLKQHPRKSVQFSKQEKRKSTILSKSPGLKFANSPAPSKKTPAKFDLQASLKKRLSYKPHIGKLKDNYQGETGSSTNFDANCTFSVSNQKSVKEITKPKVTRTDRRKEVTQRRANKRTSELAKRRGIVA